MAKYITIKVMDDGATPINAIIRIVKQQGKFALHRKYREEDRGIYSITCLQTGTTILSRLNGKKYGLLCLEQIAEMFPDFDYDNVEHRKAIWEHIKRDYYRSEIFG